MKQSQEREGDQTIDNIHYIVLEFGWYSMIFYVCCLNSRSVMSVYEFQQSSLVSQSRYWHGEFMETYNCIFVYNNMMSLFNCGDRLEQYHTTQSLASGKKVLTQFVNLDIFCIELHNKCDD